MIPLSAEIERSNRGYTIKRNCERVNHFLYMDDLKIFAKNEEDMNKTLKVVEDVCTDIGMKLGYDKCARIVMKKVKLVSATNTENNQSLIKHLEADQSYKYLGFLENCQLQQSEIKQKIKDEYFRRLRLILRFELHGKNKIDAANSLAVPVIDYSFGIIEWTQEELRKLDTKTRKCLTMNQMLHPRSDVSRLYIPRRNGGRGLRNIFDAHEMAILRMGKYINSANENDKILKLIYQCMSESVTQKTIINKAERLKSQLNIEDTNMMSIKNYKNKVKQAYIKRNEEEWRKKTIAWAIQETN
ncbi:hypothetical protein WDU94_002041 [Cyamophila willieti]